LGQPERIGDWVDFGTSAFQNFIFASFLRHGVKMKQNQIENIKLRKSNDTEKWYKANRENN